MDVVLPANGLCCRSQWLFAAWLRAMKVTCSWTYLVLAARQRRKQSPAGVDVPNTATVSYSSIHLKMMLVVI